MSAQGARWLKCLSVNGNVRGVAVQATELINELASMHKMQNDPDGVRMLGEAVIGAVLIASYCKAGEKINLNIRATGHVFQALVEACAEGTVRGYVIPSSRVVNPEDASPASPEKPLGPWGDGLMSVLRTKDGENKQPYIGTVPLVTGYLAKDLTFYWSQSEQVPSSVGLAVNVEPSGVVSSAAGFLIQALPGATDQEIQAVEKNIVSIESYSERVAQDAAPLELLSNVFQDSPFMLLEERPLVFSCPCTSERVERSLVLIGKAEVESLLKEMGKIEVTCDFCSKLYVLEKSAVEELLKRHTSME